MMASCHAVAQEVVLQPQSKDGKTYTPVKWSGITEAKVAESDTMAVYRYDGGLATYNMKETEMVNGHTVPLITITTDEELEQIPDKVNYKTAKITLEGFGAYDDVDAEVSIRGRGNSSWAISDKKPYRLKFSKKIALCGLNKAKNYVLLAGWTDGSLMQNAVAAKIGHILEVPYVCDMIPVDVILNGVYRGCYLLANKPGINAGNVDIDEPTSIMWELDTSMDEEFTFRSPIHDLPVMVKDPDMDEARFLEWKEDFINMEKALSEGKADEWVDIPEYAAYRAVYEIMGNDEIGWPKSLKMYKTEGEKYKFGPLWDFDVAMGVVNFGNELDGYHIERARKDLWINYLMDDIDNAPGADKYIKDAIQKFVDNQDELWSFIDETAAKMETSAARNTRRWPDRGNWHEQVGLMKTWLAARITYLKEKYEITAE